MLPVLGLLATFFSFIDAVRLYTFIFHSYFPSVVLGFGARRLQSQWIGKRPSHFGTVSDGCFYSFVAETICSKFYRIACEYDDFLSLCIGDHLH